MAPPPDQLSTPGEKESKEASLTSPEDVERDADVDIKDYQTPTEHVAPKVENQMSKTVWILVCLGLYLGALLYGTFYSISNTLFSG